MKKTFIIGILSMLSLILFVSCAKPQDGDDGKDGRNGVDGTSCTVVTVAPGPIATYGGGLISCGGSTVLITNGAPGAQGIPGPISSYGVTELIDPCGDTPGVNDEVFLLLANGILVWSFSDNINGYNTRLSLAVDGAFQTTDGSGCTFSIATAGNQRTITWTGGSKTWVVQ